ncbi:MAG: hypothetical protein LBT38_01035 [Deltaproteobacteria bacterium]|nr:hypothetical protein [Deltaproteobacteria bacterium]
MGHAKILANWPDTLFIILAGVSVSSSPHVNYIYIDPLGEEKANPNSILGEFRGLPALLWVFPVFVLAPMPISHWRL